MTVTDCDIEKSSKGCIPTNTAHSTGWALQTFQQWVTLRNKRSKDGYPSDLFDEPYPPDRLCSCLQCFVSVARRADGMQYPPKTLYLMLCGLLRHLREVQPNPPNFLDRKNVHFKTTHGTCDSIFCTLYEDGIGAEMKLAHDGEQRYALGNWCSQYRHSRWASKSCTLLCTLSKFAACEISQFMRLDNPEVCVTEHGSKNRNGGFYQLHVDNKSATFF